MAIDSEGRAARQEGFQPAVSVVVVSWNTRELLARCLESLATDVTRGVAEVVVVDNASTDGSPELVRDSFTWARLLALDDNAGFGAAINRGAAVARGRWLALSNADISLHRGALDTLLAAGDGDARAGAVAPRLVLPDGSTQHSVFAFPTVPLALIYNLGLASLSRRLGERLLLVGAWDPDRPRRVPWAVGAFLLVRRTAWEAIGGFDEHQWMYAEDLDLGWRLRRARWHTLYEPAAVVDHHSAAATTQAWGSGLTARWQRATYAWMLRRRGWPTTRAVAAINVIGCAVRWLALAPLSRLRPRWAGSRRTARWWMALHAQGLASARSLREHR